MARETTAPLFSKRRRMRWQRKLIDATEAPVSSCTVFGNQRAVTDSASTQPPLVDRNGFERCHLRCAAGL